MSNVVIKVHNLSKQYFLGSENVYQETFRDMLTDLAKAPLRRLRKLQGRSEQPESFWAVKDISFEIRQGEVVGIIGANGAGKSTILKLLSRITAPTEGEIEYRGRMASLLEVGTGFHPELSGRENVFVNGAILGMNKVEINKRFDEIVDFAGIEKFLDTPVKRYSSGMYVRLAFSVAAHLESDILIVDEVLAVGDANFQKKCLGKMAAVAERGKTVLFVSHNMAAVMRLCSRGMWIENGHMEKIGSIDEIVQAYLSASLERTNEKPTRDMRTPAGMGINSVAFGRESDSTNSMETKVGYYDSPTYVYVGYDCPKLSADYVLAVRVTDSLGNELFTSWDVDSEVGVRPNHGVASCRLPAFLLKPGDYYLTVLLQELTYPGVRVKDEKSLTFTVNPRGYHAIPGRIGLIAPNLEWKYKVSGDSR